ncbi:hypothetical protein [Shewanella algae]|uniref:hypothetical protein n=1 Tax=Shewanella algae TaxID=38313 RepID=UPI0030055566
MKSKNKNRLIHCVGVALSIGVLATTGTLWVMVIAWLALIGNTWGLWRPVEWYN